MNPDGPSEAQWKHADLDLEVPAQFNFARDVIDRWGEQPALLHIGADGEQRLSYAELSTASRSLACGLRGRGVSTGQTVMLMLGRRLEWWYAMTACIRSGLIASPATTQLSVDDILYRLTAANVRCVICTPGEIHHVSAAVARLDAGADAPLLICAGSAGAALPAGWLAYETVLAAPGEDAEVDTRAGEDSLCFFTSGTTGKPKMTMHTHASYGIGHRITAHCWLALTADDLHWNISDTGWAKAAWSSYFAPMICGACIFVDAEAAFDAERTLHLLAQYPITTMCGAPTVYRMLVQADLQHFRPRALRDCVAAGEPLNPEIIATWSEVTGITIRDGYGQTETVLLCGNFPGMPTRPGAMGRPAPGFDVAILDEHQQSAADGVEGDIAIRLRPQRPVGLFREYRGAEEATRAAFSGDWYLTGDRAIRDADGYFWFVGRADDVMLSSGYRIGPFEVESALLEHPAVAESAVVASPDATRGEIVKAFVVLAAGHQGSEALVEQLQQHVKQTTAPYKYPRQIEFVEELPKTVSGKIRRNVLRERERRRVQVDA
jgi:medium-chain acyl-CoA synthetase